MREKEREREPFELGRFPLGRRLGFMRSERFTSALERMQVAQAAFATIPLQITNLRTRTPRRFRKKSQTSSFRVSGKKPST